MTASPRDPSSSSPKAALRAAARAARAALTPAQRQRASATIVEALEAWLVAHVPATTPVALYAGIQDEVDVGGLAARRLVAYPRMDGDALAFHVTSPAALVPGRFGIAEPAATAPRVALHELGAIVMPLLAVDPRGHRLGWGRGYYDRTLASHHSLPPLLGAAFACQLVARVPADAHDVPVHLVFTEAGIAGGPGWPAVRSAPGA